MREKNLFRRIFRRRRCLFDDASVHMIGQLLVDLCGLLVDCLVEWVVGTLESLVEVQKWHILNKADSDDTSHFSHFSESWIVNIKPKRIWQVPFHESVVKRVKNGTNEHGLSKKIIHGKGKLRKNHGIL